MNAPYFASSSSAAAAVMGGGKKLVVVAGSKLNGMGKGGTAQGQDVV